MPSTRFHNYFVYILRCADGSYYTGVTNDLERRMLEHFEGVDRGCFTFSRRPVELAHYEWFNRVEQALAREKQLKGWSRRKKEALIAGDLRSLSLNSLAYSRRVFPPLHKGDI
ncbi:MAG: GIY-YIG nuclease family protein [Flavobacteriales bacterium]|nr:MAG: GIY-YIG nuclease family protein [Flavobacteriales bacterium]